MANPNAPAPKKSGASRLLIIVGAIVLTFIGCSAAVGFFVFSKVSDAVGDASGEFAELRGKVADAKRQAAEASARAAEARAAAGKGGPAEKPPADAARSEKSLKRYACAGVMECFTKNEHIGPFGLRVESEIGSDGKVSSVRLAGGTAPDGIVTCIEEGLMGKNVPDYPTGKTATMRCEMSGQLGPGVMEVNQSTSFEFE